MHVFVYGGEYNQPLGGDPALIALHAPASLGARLKRTPEWKGYEIQEIPEIDPDFNLLNGVAEYSPLSDRALRLSGQKGLAVGDIIVGVNGESVMSVPDIHMLLRGLAGRTVRLEVLRLKSGEAVTGEAIPEPVLAVPISHSAASKLRYDAWEWKTREKAKELASEAGFTVGYMHLKSMGTQGENEFARNFYPDYDKQALILDVRHNGGYVSNLYTFGLIDVLRYLPSHSINFFPFSGNIDSWILDALQRKAWMYWGDRTGVRNGGLDWDEQYAFRGHLVVLVDEHTGSDAEGVSRGISELGLGRIIGTRTWGGGIWLSSDNHLVDGGIATAPEMGTFNSNWGWGGGIENQGITPDIVVDNNPRTAFHGKDEQLERAIAELKSWLKEEAVVMEKPPKTKPDMSLKDENCPA